MLFLSRFSRITASISLLVFNVISAFLTSNVFITGLNASALTIFLPKFSPNLLIDKFRILKVLLDFKTWISASSIDSSKEHEDKFSDSSCTMFTNAKMCAAPSAKIGFNFKSKVSILRLLRMLARAIVPLEARIGKEKSFKIETLKQTRNQLTNKIVA